MKYQLTISILILILILSCNGDGEDIFSMDVGEDWVDVKTKVYHIDTLTVKLSTFQFDSITVSNAKRLMIGSYNDPEFGLIKSESYIQLKNSDLYEIDDKAEFDSISLVLKFDKYFYNDTIPSQEFKVHKVLEDIEPDDDDNFYYNTTNFKTSSTPLTSNIFKPRPNKIDTLSIKLDNIYGETLFNKIKNNEFNSDEEFLEEYKGLMIAAGETNTSILGFSINSEMKIYYTIDNGVEFESEEKIINFQINPTYSFNHIESNNEGTVLEDLDGSLKILPSYETNNNSFVQSGTGITSRIDIPYLETLNDIPGDGVIIDAFLKISLKQNSNTHYLQTRDSLKLKIVNHKSEIIDNLLDYVGNAVTGVVEEKNSEFNITTYSFPIRSFLDIKFADPKPENLFLIISPQDFNSSLDRYIFKSENAVNDRDIKLEITYAIYHED